MLLAPTDLFRVVAVASLSSPCILHTPLISNSWQLILALTTQAIQEVSHRRERFEEKATSGIRASYSRDRLVVVKLPALPADEDGHSAAKRQSDGS